MSVGARLAALRNDKLRRMIDGHAETLDRLRHARATVAPDGFDLWVHAASLGEFEQARPVIEAYRKALPQAKVLLSFFSPSGYCVRHNYDGADCVVYLSFDTPRNVRQFLDAAQPKCAVFVKYEFWSNYLHEIAKRHIPLYLISAIFRPGQRFFKLWGAFSRDVLRTYTHIFVQDRESLDLLASVGITNVTVAGDTRFDRVAQVAEDSRPIPELARWLHGDDGQGQPVFTLVVGSSWPQDEACYIPWLNEHPEVKAIVAPHEFDDKRLKTLVDSFAAKAVLWSQVLAKGRGPEPSTTKPDNANPDSSSANSSTNPAVPDNNSATPSIPDDAQVVIIDCFGLLSRIYRYGDAAIIGGGLGTGIHNINEAAVYGIPVAFGPNNGKFREAAALIADNAAFEYHDRAECSIILTRWLTDPAGRRHQGTNAAAYIRTNRGATSLIMHTLLPD